MLELIFSDLSSFFLLFPCFLFFLLFFFLCCGVFSFLFPLPFPFCLFPAKLDWSVERADHGWVERGLASTGIKIVGRTARTMRVPVTVPLGAD